MTNEEARRPEQTLASGAYVSVRSAPYNARGNGVADDQPAIQRAIDAVLAAGGGTVYFPAGRYALRSRPLTLTSQGLGRSLRLVGESAEASTLLLGRPGACIYDRPADESIDLCLERLGFDANGFPASSCVVLATVHGLRIDGCLFKNTVSQPALRVGRPQDYYQHPGRRVQSTDVRISRCRFPQHRGARAFAAVRLANVAGGSLTGCEFDGHDYGAVFLQLYCFDFSVTDNVFRGALPGAFDILVANSGADDPAESEPSIVVARNRHILPNRGSKAIVLQNVVRALVESESILGSIAERGAPNGIVVVDIADGCECHPLVNPDSHDIVIRNNVIKDTYHGIALASSQQTHDKNLRVSNVDIEENVCSGQVASAIQIGCPTVQDVRRVTVTRNRMELPRSPVAAAMNVVGNPGYPVVTLEQGVVGTPSIYGRPQTVWVSGSEGTVTEERLDVGRGSERETIGVRAVSGRQITARFWKSHRAGEKMVPSVSGKGIAEVRLLENVVAAGPDSRAEDAIAVADAEVDQIWRNDLAAARRAVVLLHGGQVKASDVGY